jgi:peptidoglycan hydrolase CwlO-like protein
MAGGRPRALAATLVLVLLATMSPSPAGAAERPDPRAERERIRSEQAAMAGEVDALEATNEEVTRALTDLEANVSDNQALFSDAQRTAELAAASLVQAQEQERQAAGKIDGLEAMVREVAVKEYMRPTTADPTVVLRSESIADASRRRAMLDFRAQRDAQVLDELRAAREDLARSRAQAEEATVRAEQERTEVAERVEKLEQARNQQADFAATVEERLDATLAEAASLASLDAEFAEQIRADEARVAAQLQAARASQAAQASQASQASRSAPSRSAPSRASDGPTPRSPGGGASRSAPSITGSGPIVSVRGFRVSSQIAESLQAMLTAADADGMNFGGGGYRDPSAQVSLRRSNCGSSDYAVYSMPASQCSPPTARPGSSMHEQGLALDFTYNGSLISSRSNPGFQWLAANAAGFGFYNLPSEPWHWSTNGN